MGSPYNEKRKLLTDFYMWMVKNEYDHNIRIRVENKAELFLRECDGKNIDTSERQLTLPVSDSLLDKGKILVEANEYADKCVRRTLFGKSRELAKQRIIVMYLLDEMFKQ